MSSISLYIIPVSRRHPAVEATAAEEKEKAAMRIAIIMFNRHNNTYLYARIYMTNGKHIHGHRNDEEEKKKRKTENIVAIKWKRDTESER